MLLSWSILAQAMLFLFLVLLDWVDWPPWNDLPLRRKNSHWKERVLTTVIAAGPCFVGLALTVFWASRPALHGIAAFCVLLYAGYAVLSFLTSWSPYFLTASEGKRRLTLQGIQLTLAVFCFALSFFLMFR